MCLLNNPFFILQQCKLYLLIADILTVAAATAAETRHLLSKGILGLGEKKKRGSKGKASILTLLLAMWNGERADALQYLKKRIRKGHFCCQHQWAPLGRIR